MFKQRKFIHDFVEKYSYPFNDELFTRSDDAIINQLQQIILSLQTEGFFTIKVTGFDVIESYSEINEIMKQWCTASTRTSKSNRKNEEDNRYDYIDLKGSAIKLLIVHYYIAIKDEEGTADVIIQVPRVVKKFYFYLNGNYYSSMYQIVDASTYNNSSTKGKKSDCVTFKTNLQPIRIYKHEYKLNDTLGNQHLLTQFDCNAFNKTVSTVNYLFAKFGLVDTLKRFHLYDVINISNYDQTDEYTYSFLGKKSNGIYVNVLKMFLDRIPIVQHIVYSICNAIESTTNINDLFGNEFWVIKLGSSFNSNDKLSKGYNVINSIESVLDFNIQNQIHLPWKYKKDIYSILSWIICEYGLLKLKDNLDINTKKIRHAEYLSAIYATKLSSNIYRLANKGKRADLKDIKRVIYTRPDFLVTEITKSQLVTFRNIVNDMDSVLALKFTYKGISGIGETSSSIPDQFRHLDISNMGILDPDASSASDPGVNGSLVPFLKVYANGYFSNKQEPITWENEYTKLFDEYKKIRGLKDVIEFKNNALGQSDDDTNIINDCENVSKNIQLGMANNMVNLEPLDSITGLPLEESGMICYECGG